MVKIRRKKLYPAFHFPFSILQEWIDMYYVGIMQRSFCICTGLDPEGLKTGAIDCLRHVSSGVSRERQRVWEGVFLLIKGSGGLPREIFLIGLPESAFPCYFQVIFFNLAGWFYFFHYENTPILIYRKCFLQKLKKNQIKNIDCGYSLEPPRRGRSNEYPQSVFRAEIRKITYTPANPSFTI